MMSEDQYKGTAIGVVLVVGVIVVAAMLFGDGKSASDEISYTDYSLLKSEVSLNCPQLKPIIALWLQEYKGISRSKHHSFIVECDKMRSADLKRQIVEDFSK